MSCDDPIEMFRGDELPAWEGTLSYNDGGVLVRPDLSTGYTFTVKLSNTQADPNVVTITTGITGYPDGRFVVAWPKGSLDIRPGQWPVQLTARRADGLEHTISDVILIKPRVLAEA